MPRGNPKKPCSVKLEPALIAQVRSYPTTLTAAIEQGLVLWIAQQEAPNAVEA